MIPVIVVLFAMLLLGIFFASEPKNGEKIQNWGFAIMMTAFFSLILVEILVVTEHLK